MGERLVQASLCTWRASHCTQAVAALVHGQACLNFHRHQPPHCPLREMLITGM